VSGVMYDVMTDECARSGVIVCMRRSRGGR